MAQFIAAVRRNYDAFPESQFTVELLEQEAEAARRLYADGVFRQMWGRQDSPGAVMLIEAASLEAAREAVDSLPLRRNGMLLLDGLIGLSPYRGFGPRG